MTAPEVLTSPSRADLAHLCREYLLCGHLIDRAGMPQVNAALGKEGMEQVAIQEWMGASPIYTKRMQRALGFEGDDVGTIFKGMQFDIGAPHQFMDFRYTVHDGTHGEFHLAHCGALMDVEPMGDEYVQGMCHDIEDPTFDATALATNPRARMRPIHRPPRTPADRHPHCAWTVTIEPHVDPVPESEHTRRVARSRAAGVVIEMGDDAEPGGSRDYSGPLDPDFQMEHLSHGALVLVAEEMCLQGHLLVRSGLLDVADRAGEDVAMDVALKQFIGVGAVATDRIKNLFDLKPGDLDGLAYLLELHPAFHPRAYVDLHVERDGDQLSVSIGDCDALHEDDSFSWFGVLRAGHAGPLESIVQALDPQAQVESTGEMSWTVTVDPSAEPAKEPPEALLTRFSTGADFQFVQPMRSGG